MLTEFEILLYYARVKKITRLGVFFFFFFGGHHKIDDGARGKSVRAYNSMT